MMYGPIDERTNAQHTQATRMRTHGTHQCARERMETRIFQLISLLQLYIALHNSYQLIP